jgi:hypothetical protein
MKIMINSKIFYKKKHVLERESETIGFALERGILNPCSEARIFKLRCKSR